MLGPPQRLSHFPISIIICLFVSSLFTMCLRNDLIKYLVRVDKVGELELGFL